MNKILGFALLAAFVAGCGGENKKAGAGNQMPPMPVGTVVAKQADVPLVLEFNGQTTPELDVVVRAKVSGTIEKQFFKPGQAVREGDPLYLIDQAKYKAAFENALGSLNVAEATLANATADYNRAGKLKAASAISQKEYDAAQAAYKSAQANVSASRANVKNAKIDLDYSTVTAPFDGVVGDTKKDVGSYVTSGDADLVRLTKLNPIFVKFGVSDKQRLEINERMAKGEWGKDSARVAIEANGKDYNGTLVFIDNIVDSNTATVDAKASFDNPKFELTPGVYTKVLVYGFHQKAGFEIPQVAILQDLAGSFVYVVEDGKVAKRPIKIASQDAITAVISSGLKDGDVIITDNFKKINLGQSVQPVPSANAQAKGNK